MKILYSNYAKGDLEQVADNSTQMNAEDINQLLRLFKYFEELFNGNIGDWYTEPVDIDL